MDALLSPLVPERSDDVATSPLPFADVYRHYLGFVFRNARALGVRPSAVDDVVQEVFVVVHGQLDALRDHSRLRPWISRILVNIVRHHRRTLARKSPHDRSGNEGSDPDELASGAPDPHQVAELGERARQVQRLLESMDDAKREVLVLAEIEELSVPEIADILGVKLNTAYSRLRLAREAFDEALARDRARNDRGMR
ncbi:MAG TPA: RNA polymerase sigma factor [Polyangiaceae bacterium]|jgi:RNA polymerase sigma-70 factor (ECF subfamily)|nr:RNA polymerase sigma factor [Polyangiaceae bacterium]